MRHVVPNPRGMALVMAMIVVVLITLLVAGAISFTGTERAASEVQAEDAAMSSCVQAARNLFISRVNHGDIYNLHWRDLVLLNQEVANLAAFNFDEKLGDPTRPTELRSGHLGGLASVSAKVAAELMDPNGGVDDISGRPGGGKPPPLFFMVTAVCHEDATDLSSPEREIEFLIRIGF